MAVGTNAFAADWVWSVASLPLPGPLARYVSGGTLKIRYGTTSQFDASDLDQLVLVGNAPAVTGARAPRVLGAIYPGNPSI